MGQISLTWIRLIIRYIVQWLSWPSDQIVLRNFESACCPDVFHHVLAESDNIRPQMVFEEFRDTTTLAILNFHVAQMPPTKFQLNLTYLSGAKVV